MFTKTTNDVLLINDTGDFFEIIDTMDIKRYHGAHFFTGSRK